MVSYGESLGSLSIGKHGETRHQDSGDD